MAIIKARPTPASQAESVNIIMGYIMGEIKQNFKAHRPKATKIDSIMLSKHRRADRR